MTFELPSGLPPAPWRAGETDFDAGWYVENDRGSFVCEVSEEVARAIASIPHMVEEIGRLREEADTTDASAADIAKENIRLRALNAELADHLAIMIGRFEKCAVVLGDSDHESIKLVTAEARAILAKSQEAAL